MNNLFIKKLFTILELKASSFKIGINRKEKNRKAFIERLKNANKNIHLLGLNFPNYFTTRENKILEAFNYLETQQRYVNVYIYMPTNKIRNHLNSLNIYKKKYISKNNNVNIYLLRDLNSRFHYLNVEVIEYEKLYMFGASAIDLGTNDAFIHLSQVKKNELIADAEYFDINYSSISRNFFKIFEIVLKNIRN